MIMSTLPPPPPGSGPTHMGGTFSNAAGPTSAGNLLLATGRHRVAALFLDFGLSIVTLGIGWFIWSLVIWGQGQSPAKQILKIKVINQQTGRPAGWGHTALYEFLFGFSIALAASALNLVTFGVIGTLGYFAFWITDFFWFYKDRECRTLRDRACKTLIINIA
jgi:RDD family